MTFRILHLTILTVPAAKPVVDFHHLVITRAKYTKKHPTCNLLANRMFLTYQYAFFLFLMIETEIIYKPNKHTSLYSSMQAISECDLANIPPIKSSFIYATLNIAHIHSTKPCNFDINILCSNRYFSFYGAIRNCCTFIVSAT